MSHKVYILTDADFEALNQRVAADPKHGFSGGSSRRKTKLLMKHIGFIITMYVAEFLT